MDQRLTKFSTAALSWTLTTSKMIISMAMAKAKITTFTKNLFLELIIFRGEWENLPMWPQQARLYFWTLWGVCLQFSNFFLEEWGSYKLLRSKAKMILLNSSTCPEINSPQGVTTTPMPSSRRQRSPTPQTFSSTLLPPIDDVSRLTNDPERRTNLGLHQGDDVREKRKVRRRKVVPRKIRGLLQRIRNTFEREKLRLVQMENDLWLQQQEMHKEKREGQKSKELEHVANIIAKVVSTKLNNDAKSNSINNHVTLDNAAGVGSATNSITNPFLRVDSKARHCFPTSFPSLWVYLIGLTLLRHFLLIMYY